MSDDALIDWMAGGAPVALPAEERFARLCSEYSLRFRLQLEQEDLGCTQETHEWAMACMIATIHSELNAHGEELYSAVWQTLPANQRRAIKHYVSMVATAR